VLERDVSLAHWAPMAQEAINAMFVLADAPQHVAVQLLQALAQRVAEPLPPSSSTTDNNNNDDDEGDVNTTTVESNDASQSSFDRADVEPAEQNDDDSKDSDNSQTDEQTPIADNDTTDTTATTSTTTNNNNNNNDKDVNKAANNARVDALGKLVHCVGHVALKLLTYIEEVHAADARRAAAAAERRNKQAAAAKRADTIEAELGEVHGVFDARARVCV
jgi:hypothetical protein